MYKNEWIVCSTSEEVYRDRYNQKVKVGDTVALTWYNNMYVGRIYRQTKEMIYIQVPCNNSFWVRQMDKYYIKKKLVVINKRINIDEL